MKKLINKYVSLLLCLLMFSCTTTGSGNKETIGTGIGAAVGALGGYLLAGKKNRALGVVAGGLAGALIGNRIGNALDERDRQALQDKIQKTLDTAKVGETETWNSDHTNASGVIKVTQETTEIKQVSVKKIPDVILAPSAQLNVAGGVRWVSTALNVRKGPGQSYDKVKTLPKNTEVSLNGVTDDNWYLISENNVVIGYVSGKHLKKIKAPVINNELPEVDPVSSEEEARVAMNTDPIEDTAIVKVKCRTVKVHLKVDGKITEDAVKTCQDSNGSWGA
jgi:surface antigen